MQKAATAFQNGRLPSDAWREIYNRFVLVQAEAIKLLGEKLRLPSSSTFNASRYIPPGKPKGRQKFSWWVYPARPVFGDSELIHPVTQSAVDKVKSIRDRALALGWTETQFFQNRGRYRFPCGQDYGLVCYLDADRQDSTIGQITDRFIEIIVNSRRQPPEVLYFFNSKADQPWIKRERIPA
jgi:hypothetical protein